MKKRNIPGKRLRLNLILDINLSEWIINEAAKVKLNETSFTRMLLAKLYNEQKTL